MIKRIEFPESKVFEDYRINGEPLTSMEPLSKINLIVGPNNSGKSRLLRNLAKQFPNYVSPTLRDDVELPGENTEGIMIVHIKIEDLIAKITDVVEKTRQISPGLCENWQKTFPNKNTVNELDILEIYHTYANLTHPKASHIVKYYNEKQKSQLNALKKQLAKTMYEIIAIEPGRKFRVSYVPTLRSLRRYELISKEEEKKNIFDITETTYSEINEPILARRAFRDYFSVPKTTITWNKTSTLEIRDIHSGENLYDQIRQLRNGTEDKRDILTSFEKFLADSFFNGETIEINAIESEDAKSIHVKIGIEKEFPIQHLGDGIQAIILLVFPIFYYRDSHHVIFYEEPELNLHPGMQRMFIDVLRKFDNTTSFIVTHSNHILDTIFDHRNDISILSIEKKVQGKLSLFNIQTVSTPDLKLLNQLGVRNSSIFLSNCVIWVEGISDRIYLKKYLELYMQSKSKTLYLEDLHFSFLEFGGNLITHYDFSDTGVDTDYHQIKALKITNRILLIHDLDEQKEKRHELLSDQLGDGYVRLPVREIENLLSPHVLLRTLNQFKRSGADDIHLEDLPTFYQNIPFGQILIPFQNKNMIKKICSATSENATPVITNKAEFAYTTVDHIRHWDDLSFEAKQLTEKIYQFIAKHN